MEYLREKYNEIINSTPEVLKEMQTEVLQMNDIALHNYANSIIRNCDSNNINRNKIKATATTLVWDLISEILCYKEQKEEITE